PGFRALGLAGPLGFLLGFRQSLAAPSLEAVVPAGTQRRLRCEVERRPGLAAVDVSLMLSDFIRPVPSDTAAEMVGYRVRDSSTTSPALLMMRHVQSGRLGVEYAITCIERSCRSGFKAAVTRGGHAAAPPRVDYQRRRLRHTRRGIRRRSLHPDVPRHHPTRLPWPSRPEDDGRRFPDR